MSTRVLLIAVILAGVISAAAFPNAKDSWVVRPDGFGSVKVGMTLEQINAALNEKLSAPQQEDDRGCYYVKSVGHPHVAFMIENGRLARVEVNAPGVPTVAGVQVGDTEAQAMTVYGRKLKVEPNRYDDDGHYLTVKTLDGRYATRFETDGKKIQTYYAGRTSVVTYPDGCN